MILIICCTYIRICVDLLQVASDDSDYEPKETEETKDTKKITTKLLKIWQQEIQTDK